MTTATRHWDVQLEMLEDRDHCEVLARLDTGERSLVGFGRSRRSQDDSPVPRIGEELATARALYDLAHQLSQDAWSLIEQHPTG
jgi:hypothetical protein